MLRRVADREIIFTYGGFRWGFTRGIILGINRGFTLEDHPLPAAKMLVTGAAGGSAGIPDSLGHKPGDTSGGLRGQRPSFATLVAFPVFLTFPSPFPLRPFISFFVLHCLGSLAPGIAIPIRGGRRRAGSLTCANRQAFYSPTMAATCPRAKRVLKMGGVFYCIRRAAELSLNCHRGNRKPAPNTTPGAAMSG